MSPLTGRAVQRRRAGLPFRRETGHARPGRHCHGAARDHLLPHFIDIQWVRRVVGWPQAPNTRARPVRPSLRVSP